jgi:hypothetical protein
MLNDQPTLLKSASLLVFLVLPFFLAAQSAPPCIFPESESDTIYLQSQDVEGATQFMTDVSFVANQDSGIYQLSVSSLKDAVRKRSIANERVILSQPRFALRKGQDVVISLVVADAVSPGLYYGMLTLQRDKCEKKLVVCLNTLSPEESGVAISETDVALAANTVPRGWFTGLIPMKERQEGVVVHLKNQGDYPAAIQSVVLELTGTNSQKVVVPDLQLSDADRILQGNQHKAVPVSLKNTALPPDEYTGKMQIYLKNQDKPLESQVTINRRCSLSLALFLLLCGIFIGFIYFWINSRKAQLDVLQQLTQAQDSLEDIEEATAKKALTKEGERILRMIRRAETEEDVEKVKAALAALKQKIAEIQELAVIYADLENRGGDNGVPESLTIAVNHWRDAILSGNEEEKAAAEQDFNAKMQEAFGGGSRSATSGMPSVRKRGANETEAAAAPAAKMSFLSKLWKVITGEMPIDLLFLYRYLVPFLKLFSLILLTFVGLQQIYLDGSPTFGAQGFYDYAKLLGWGAFSNIATGSIIGNPLLNKFSTSSEAAVS